MKETTKEFWKKAAHFFFVKRFFSTFWSIIGVIFIIVALCLLPKALRVAKRVRGESRQALVESRSALRETRKAIRDGYRAAEYMRQPFEVKIQLHGTSDWLDIVTTGKAVIAPQEKTPASAPAAVSEEKK